MDKEKLHFDSWKIFRIISEFVDGFETMHELGPSVSIFGSSRLKKGHPYYDLAKEVAKKIAELGLGVITGGGPGLMEAANLGAQEGGGKSCGVCINLPFEDDSNPYIDRNYHIKLRYFFVRKVLFVRYAQAFIFLPGGLGTLDELFEAMTLIQTGRIKPLPLFLMGKEHWKGMLSWIQERLVGGGFISQADTADLIITDDPALVAKKIAAYHKERGSEMTFDLDRPSQNTSQPPPKAL